MRKFVVPGVISALAVAVVLLLVFGISGHGDARSIDAQVASGRYPLAPNDTMRLTLLGSSRRTDLASFRGKVVIVNVFASWCDPCATEAPILAAEQRLLLKHDGTLLGVTYEDAASSTEAFVRRYHVSYPVVRDVDGDLTRSLGVDGVPETFVINRRGQIQALRRYQLTRQWLDRTVPPILAEPA